MLLGVNNMPQKESLARQWLQAVRFLLLPLAGYPVRQIFFVKKTAEPHAAPPFVNIK
jgi:hypothetical protein